MTEESLFELARKTPEAERPALLDRACEGNPALRKRVEALLQADAGSSPLSKPSPIQEATTGFQGTVSYASPDPEPGILIASRYTLEQKLGEGGMGEVWVAKQSEPVKRKVALKLIKAGMDSKSVVQRFEQERQALAMMDHPNIAKVLDGGLTSDRRPFFVMELVNGLPLTKFCDEAKLGIKERLELFVPICQAVQHAHQKGIVHRDLKPSNILITMIDGKPVPKVIDFGVAKATSGRLTEESLSTQFGAVVGTLEYMSPEQAGFSGEDIDTRADIYSLGVILYELLTGLRPFDTKQLKKAALDEMIRMIREEEPSKPSTRLSTDESLPSLAASRHMEPGKLTALLRGELDWVVMKCLEKQRDRRYETANGLARDIQRYLSDELVEARPPSTAYRFQKFVSRHKGQVIAAGLLLLSLVAGIIGTSLGMAQANKARKAEAERAEAEVHERHRAEKAEAESRKRADELEKVSDFQAAMLARIDKTRAGNLMSNDVIEKHLAALMKSEVPEKNRSTIHEAFVTEWQRVNAVDTAVSFIDREIMKPAILAVDKQFKNQPLVDAQLRSVLAKLYSSLGQFDAARPLAEQTLSIRRKQLGENHPDTLKALIQLGSIFLQQAKHADAETCLREALSKAKASLGESHTVTRSAMASLVLCLAYRGKHSEAEMLSREALERDRRTFGSDHPNTLSSLSSYAICLDSLGKDSEAMPLLKEVMESSRRILGEDDPDTLTSIANYAESALPSEKEKLLREVLDKRRRVLGEEYFETVWSMTTLAYFLASQKKYDESETLFREALVKMRRIRGDTHTNVLTVCNGLGELLHRRGKSVEAEAMLRSVVDKGRRQYGTAIPEMKYGMRFLGSLLLSQKRYQEAEVILRELFDVIQTQNVNDWRTYDIQSKLGGSLLGQKKYIEAEPLLLDGYIGIIQREKNIPPTAKTSLPEALDRLIQLYTETNKPEEVKKWQAEKDKLPKAPEKK